MCLCWLSSRHIILFETKSPLLFPLLNWRDVPHSASADGLPLAIVCWFLDFTSPDSFPGSPSPAPLSGPWGQSLPLEHIPSGKSAPAPGSHGETASRVNFRLQPFRWRSSAWSSAPYFLHKSKRNCGLNLGYAIRPICPVPSVANLPEMHQSPHPMSKWSSLHCTHGVQVSHYIKSFDHLFEVWVGSKNQN